MVRVVVPKLALEARLATVGLTGKVALEPDHLVEPVHLRHHLAPDRAVGANGRDLLYGLLPFVITLNERAGGTNVYAGAAKLAARLEQRFPARGPDEGHAGSAGQGEGRIEAHLFTDAHATRADDAQVVVAVVERVVGVYRQVAAVIVERRAQVQLHAAHGVFQLATFVLGANRAAVCDADVALADVLRAAQFDPVAGEAAVRVLGHQEFDYVPAQVCDLLRLRIHHQVRRDRRCAGGDNSFPAAHFRFDDAGPARPVRLHLREVAQVRDVDAGVHRRLQHGLARLRLYRLAVDRERNVVCH